MGGFGLNVAEIAAELQKEWPPAHAHLSYLGSDSVLLRPDHRSRLARGVRFEKLLSDSGEQAWRQHAENDAGKVAVDCRAQVRSRPAKLVALRNDDPRSLGVEPEALFGYCRNFNRDRIGRKRVSDGQNADKQRCVIVALHDKHNRARTVLDAFFAPGATCAGGDGA